MPTETRTLTAVMDFQDGTPFDGTLEVRLNASSKTDEKLVAPRVWQEVPFTDGSAAVELYPNSVLEEGSYYTVHVYSTSTVKGYKSKTKILETAFTMPDADACLHELATLTPMSPSAVDAVRLIANEAAASAESAAASAESAMSAVSEISPLTSAEIEGVFAEDDRA